MDFIGKNHVAWALLPDADLYDPDPATDVFNMKQYGHITFVLLEGVGGTGTVKIEVEQCTKADGTGNTAIAFRYRLMGTTDTWGALTAALAAGYTTVAGANKAVAIEIDASELADGYNFVRLQLTEVVDDPCDAAVIAILSEPRYAQDVPPTAIA